MLTTTNIIFKHTRIEGRFSKSVEMVSVVFSGGISDHFIASQLITVFEPCHLAGNLIMVMMSQQHSSMLLFLLTVSQYLHSRSDQMSCLKSMSLKLPIPYSYHVHVQNAIQIYKKNYNLYSVHFVEGQSQPQSLSNKYKVKVQTYFHQKRYSTCKSALFWVARRM